MFELSKVRCVQSLKVCKFIRRPHRGHQACGMLSALPPPVVLPLGLKNPGLASPPLGGRWGGDVTTSPPPSSGPSRINPKKRPQQNTPKSSIVANWAPKTIPKLNQHGVMFSISRILWFLQPLSIDITEIDGLREFFFALFRSCFSRSSPDSFALCFASIFHIFEIPFSAQWDPQNPTKF